MNHFVANKEYNLGDSLYGEIWDNATDSWVSVEATVCGLGTFEVFGDEYEVIEHPEFSNITLTDENESDITHYVDTELLTRALENMRNVYWAVEVG